ncbi:MAG: hypothetical protein A4E42_00634 [Methanoregulaceae archaeon PtaU1.Bin222]|nr:MAG: hypothetical protein A4E42_00634 [Methanoregulaceae archaeon PtaU1.Bin222]
MPPVEHIKNHDIVPFNHKHNPVIPDTDAIFFWVCILERSNVFVGTGGWGIAFETGQGISYPDLENGGNSLEFSLGRPSTSTRNVRVHPGV